MGFMRQYEAMFGGTQDLLLLHKDASESMRVSKQKRSCRLTYGQLVHESDLSAVQQQFSLYDAGVLQCRDFSSIPETGENCFWSWSSDFISEKYSEKNPFFPQSV